MCSRLEELARGWEHISSTLLSTIETMLTLRNGALPSGVRPLTGEMPTVKPNLRPQRPNNQRSAMGNSTVRNGLNAAATANTLRSEPRSSSKSQLSPRDLTNYVRRLAVIPIIPDATALQKSKSAVAVPVRGGEL